MQPLAPLPMSEPPEPLAPIPPLIPQQPMEQVPAMPQVPPLNEGPEEEIKAAEPVPGTLEPAITAEETQKAEVDISKEEEMAAIAEEVEEAKEGDANLVGVAQPPVSLQVSKEINQEESPEVAIEDNKAPNEQEEESAFATVEEAKEEPKLQSEEVNQEEQNNQTDQPQPGSFSEIDGILEIFGLTQEMLLSFDISAEVLFFLSSNNTFFAAGSFKSSRGRQDCHPERNFSFATCSSSTPSSLASTNSKLARAKRSTTE